MILLKILGLIDLASSIVFLSLAFGLTLPFQFILFCSGLLLLKSLFIFTTGDILSIVDLISGICLIFSIFFTLPSILVWIPAFLLIAKAVVSFV
ncbi:MAG: hypothetical protein AABX66_01805 [Nanoarchaeota archaeon]